MTDIAASIDATGLSCPHPVLLARAALKALPGGAVIELLADDPLIEVDLPAWCHSSGNELLELRRDGDGWVGRVAVRRGAGRGAGAPPRAPGPGRSAGG